MRHINIDLSMQSNHFSQEMVHEGPFSDTRSPTIRSSSMEAPGLHETNFRPITMMQLA